MKASFQMKSSNVRYERGSWHRYERSKDANPELLLINVPQLIKTHVPDPKKLLVAF